MYLYLKSGMKYSALMSTQNLECSPFNKKQNLKVRIVEIAILNFKFLLLFNYNEYIHAYGCKNELIH